jgi:hypothetical protein
MKTTLSTTQAAYMLLDDEDASWSRAGAVALCEYLEEFEDDMGNEEIEFCPVSIRCEFSEYDSLEDWASEYFANHVQAVFELKLNINGDGKIEETDDDVDNQIRDYIRDRGQLIEFDGGIIVSSF